MWTSLEPLWWSFAVRVCQTFIWASPYVLFGVCSAGVLRTLVPPDAIRTAFNGRGWAARMRLWLLAILLPWSSFGVLPAARQMQGAGVRPSVLLAFLLIAPVVNVLTLAYAFSVMPTRAAIVFVAGAVIVPALIAAICGRIFFSKTDEPNVAAELPAPAGHRKVALAFVTAARELTGPLFADLLIGLTGVGLLAALVPGNVLELTLGRPGLLAPPLAVLVAVPASLSPHQGMMVAGVAFSEGNSLGAAFVLLLLGVGVNLGWLWRVGQNYGLKRLVWLSALLFTLAIVYGYVADAVLPHLRTSLNHHHALTDLGPVENFGTGAEAFRHFLSRVGREAEPPEQVALSCLGLLAAAGLLLRWLDRGERITKWLAAPARGMADVPAPWWNPSLSRGMLTLAGIVCGLAVLVAGLYVYFPSPEALMEDLRYTATDVYVAGTRGDRRQAMERMDKLEGLVGELPASAMLRRGPLNAECREDVDRLRECTMSLRQAVNHGTRDQIKAAGLGFHQILHNFHQAYAS